MMIEILDDLVNDSYKDHVENMLTNPQFPWSFRSGTVTDNFKSYIRCPYAVDTPQFTHLFFVRDKIKSDHSNLIEPLIQALEDKYQKKYYNRLIRAKANCQFKDAGYPTNCYASPHSDFLSLKGSKIETQSLLYYVNYSDGDTFIFNEKFYGETINKLTINKKVTPSRGKSILFDSTYLHAGSPPRIHQYRMIINLVFIKDNK